MDTLNDLLQFSINALSLGSLYALMALGLAIVYGILRLVNFAYGELVMVGGYTLLVLGAGWMPWVIVAILAVAMAVITSLLLERVAFRPVRNASANTMLVTSFAVSVLLQNTALLLVSPRAQAVALPSIFTQNITVGGLTISTMNILTLVVCFTLLGLLTLFLTRSLLGIALRAAADDFTTPLDMLDESRLHRVFASQAGEGEALIAKENIAIRGLRRLYSVDMQFVGQTHLLRVPLDRPDVDRETLRHLFETAYFDRFRVELRDIRANLVNANCSVIGTRAELDLSALIDPGGRRAGMSEAMRTRRPVHLGGCWHDTPIYWRDHLPGRFTLAGPAVIEQMDSTVLIEPGDRARGDGDGNIVIEIGGGG